MHAAATCRSCISPGSSSSTAPWAEEALAIHNGDAIQVTSQASRMACSISISESNAYTAGHCGSVGSQVLLNGRVVGEITRNLLAEGMGTDIATILIYDHITAHPAPRALDYRPSAGDQVTSSDGSRGEILPDSNGKKLIGLGGQLHQADVVAATLATQPGQSGGPIYKEGQLIGLVQGGNLKDITYITLLDF